MKTYLIINNKYLNYMKLNELKDKARKSCIKGFSTMRKEELIAALDKNEEIRLTDDANAKKKIAIEKRKIADEKMKIADEKMKIAKQKKKLAEKLKKC